jgi:CRP-like cAMP-binding protein
MMRVIPVGQLAKFESLKGLNAEELGQLLETCDEIMFQPGDVVLMAGQQERALWILVMGHAKVAIDVSQQGGQRVSEIEPGSIIGEMSFLHPAPHSATVTCDSSCTFARLDRVRFDALAAQHPVLAARLILNVAELLAARLQAADQWMSDWLATAEDSRHRERAEQLRQAFVMRTPSTAVFLGVKST